MSEPQVTCETLLEIAKDEWKTFKQYSNMPEPFRTFATDELKHFSHAAIIIQEKCPKQKKEIDALIKERAE
jgi:hypothetical protein